MSLSWELPDGRATVRGLSNDCAFRKVFRRELREKVYLCIGRVFD